MSAQIHIGGVSAAELAKIYGTPLYVYDEQRIRQNIRRVQHAFRSRYEKFQLFYALKCNSHPAIANILIEEGAGLDTASPVEIALAQRLGLSGDRILFSGNFLSDDDLRVAISSGALINLDDLSLLPRLMAFGQPKALCFRINPGIGRSNVGEEDVLAGAQAKFGIPFERTAEAFAAARDAGVQRFGVHMMTGSCVTDADYFRQITERLMDIVGDAARALSLQFDFINIGGGLGIPYRPDESALDIERTAAMVVETFRAKCAQHHLSPPTLMMEPGRYLVGDAGFLLGRVHAIKNSYRRYVGTDIGFSTLMRPTLYDAYHHIRVDGKAGQPMEPTNLTGQLCENTDVWCVDRDLPHLDIGDVIVVENAGAYGYCMSFPYNGRLRAAEVLVNNGEHALIRRRETLDDVLANTAFPYWIMESTR